MKKGVWIICIKSYCIDGKEISKGRMKYSYARFPVSGLWLRATEDEIETKQWFKGKWFNLKNI